MSRLPRRLSLLAPLALVAGLGLTACGNHGVAIQSREHNTARGVDGHVGDVLVRDAQITLGLDGTGLLSVALFNDAFAADALTAVTSPEASSFQLPAGATAFAGAYAGATPSDTPTVASPTVTSPAVSSSKSAAAATSKAPGPATAPVAATATRSASASPKPASEGARSIALPGQTAVFLNGVLTTIIVRGLPADAAVGVSIPVTFTFVGAGTLTVQVPVSGAASTGSPNAPLPTVSDADKQNGPPSSPSQG